MLREMGGGGDTGRGKKENLGLVCIEKFPPRRLRQRNLEISTRQKDGGACKHVGAKLEAKDGAVKVVGVVPRLLCQLRVQLVEALGKQNADVVEDELVRMLRMDDAVHFTFPSDAASREHSCESVALSRVARNSVHLSLSGAHGKPLNPKPMDSCDLRRMRYKEGQ